MEEIKNKITIEMRNKLREPFPDKAYSQHPTKPFLTTLKAMYVTERLNDVFGIGRWSIKSEIIERTNDYILLQGEFISLDYDVILPKQFGGHQTTGINVEIADGYKSALTDCQSKIASYLEIGIDMFKGLIKVPKQPNDNNGSEGNTSIPSKTLTQKEVENKWNGKIYNGCVFIDNVKYKLPDDQVKKLQVHSKFKPNDNGKSN